MAVVIWTDEYRIGNDEIDRQHQHIVALVNSLEVASASGDGARTCDMVLTHLLWYLAQHFSSEEQLMAAVEYPDIEEHRREHSECRRRMAQLVSSIERGEIDVKDCVPYIRTWVHEHMLGSDRRYAVWVKEKPEAVLHWAEHIGSNIFAWTAA